LGIGPFISVKTTNEREAEKEMYRIIDEMDVEPSDITLGEYLDKWLAIKSTLEYNILRRYRGMIENYFKPDMGDIPLCNLRTVQQQKQKPAIACGA
jgi:hypothetical protein